MNESLPLPNFIRKNLEPITEEWRDFAETLAPNGTADFTLRNHIHPILFFIADDIESIQNAHQQMKKSQGKSDKAVSPGVGHAVLRHEAGFDVMQMVAEFRALRATVTKLWTKARGVTDTDMLHLIRFNEAIDQLIAQSLASFMEHYEPKRETA